MEGSWRRQKLTGRMEVRLQAFWKCDFAANTTGCRAALAHPLRCQTHQLKGCAWSHVYTQQVHGPTAAPTPLCSAASPPAPPAHLPAWSAW